MATDLLNFLPLFPDDDEDAILARMRDWANEGLDPVADVDLWVDTREGSHWYVSVMPTVREIARLYDLAGTEVVAAGMPVWAWGDYLDDHAEVQRVVRLAATPATGEVTFTGDPDVVIAAGTTVGVAPISPDDPTPEFEVTTGGTIPAGGNVTLPVRATEDGIAGNVSAGAVSIVSTPGLDVAVTNAVPMIGGTDAESDVALRERVLGAYVGQGAGNRADYERWSRAWEGVGRVTVIPLWDGPNTVKVIVTTADGQPVSAATVAGLQADLDPTVGRGDGQAPIGAIVTVETAVALPVVIAATVEFEPGYSMDGVGGTIAGRADIVAALGDYVERVQSGGELVYEQIRGRIVTVTGVHDVGGVTLNGGTVNIPVSDAPPEAPQLTDTTGLVEGAV